MSNGTKAGIVIAVVLLLGGGYFWSERKAEKIASNENTSQQENQNTEVDTTGGVTARDASDESLDRDSVQLDAELSAFASDSSSADSSINDKQVSE